MRIEKIETVELLDWEKDFGLDIVVTNWSEGLFRAELKKWKYDNGSNIISYGINLDSALECLAGDIRGEVINHPCHPKIICPLLVHTKMVGPEEYTSSVKETILGKLNIETGEWTNLNPNIQPPIDAEGWEQINNYTYISKIYKSYINQSIIDVKFYINISNPLDGSLYITSVFSPDKQIVIDGKYFHFYNELANLKHTDEFKTQCFKIANYICSRLCDKIEK